MVILGQAVGTSECGPGLVTPRHAHCERRISPPANSPPTPDEKSQIYIAPTCGLDLSLRRLDLLTGSYLAWNFLRLSRP